MSDVAIRAENLSKCYRIYSHPFDRVREALGSSKRHEEFWALKDVSFEVPKGTTWGLIGVNGAGKSTLLKILAGKLRQSEGHTDVNGKVSCVLELGTGFQESLTGRQNARINALFSGHDPWEVEAVLDQIVEFAEIGVYADRQLRTYSSGMKSRLAFSVLTSLNPEILLLDEALATGDTGFAAKCRGFMRKLARRGCTTIVASHDVGFLVQACDHVLWLDHGVLKEQGDPTMVIQSYIKALGLGSSANPDRPNNILLRFTAAEEGAELDYPLHRVRFMGPEQEYAGFYPGYEESFAEAASIAGTFGFIPTHGYRGWGPEARLDPPGCQVRSLRPHEGLEGAAYLSLPVPPFPEPLPDGLELVGSNQLTSDLVADIFFEGRFHRLGTFGADRGPGSEGLHMQPHVFPLPWSNDYAGGAVAEGALANS